MSVASLANTVVTIQRRSLTLDATGGNVEAWTTLRRLRGRVQPLSGAEQALYSRDQEQVNGKAYFPGVVDITSADRLSFRGKIASVVNVRNPDEMDRYTVVEFRYQEDLLT